MQWYYVSFLEKIYYFCNMEPFQVNVITHSNELPELPEQNFFHSVTLFRMYETTSGHRPMMAIAYDREGHIMGHLLAIIRRRGAFMPPYLYSQGRIFGEGVYADGVDQEEVFSILLKAVTRRFRRHLCLYTEFSDISTKMFGYRYFRENNYFPIQWQEIHNSLYNRPPEERLTTKMRHRLRQSERLGVITRKIANAEELHAFYKLLHGKKKLKIRRFIPPEKLFMELNKSSHADIFITLYKEKIIGGSVCLYSNGNAYLWFAASKQKVYWRLHAQSQTVWNAIKYAYENNYAHMYFLDVGLPFKNTPYKEFILNFGGNPVTKFRWFRFSVHWINSLFSWFFRE